MMQLSLPFQAGASSWLLLEFGVLCTVPELREAELRRMMKEASTLFRYRQLTDFVAKSFSGGGCAISRADGLP